MDMCYTCITRGFLPQSLKTNKHWEAQEHGIEDIQNIVGKAWTQI